MIYQAETEISSQKEKALLDHSNDIKVLRNTKSRKKLNLVKKSHDHRYESFSSSSHTTSFVRKSTADPDPLLLRGSNDSNAINYFIEKYLPRGTSVDEILPEMNRIMERKDGEI